MSKIFVSGSATEKDYQKIIKELVEAGHIVDISPNFEIEND